jgi:hypothetical protein
MPRSAFGGCAPPSSATKSTRPWKLQLGTVAMFLDEAITLF